jgi:hypothetical protein
MSDLSGVEEPSNSNDIAPEGQTAGLLAEPRETNISNSELAKMEDIVVSTSTTRNEIKTDNTSTPVSEAPEGLADVKIPVTALGCVATHFPEVKSSVLAVETALSLQDDSKVTDNASAAGVAPTGGLTIRLAKGSSAPSTPIITSFPSSAAGAQTTNPMMTVIAAPSPPIRRNSFGGRLRHCFNLWGRK